MLNKLLSYLSYDIGIDLGTATTLVYVKGKGILVREPSVVTIHKKTKEVLAVGSEAKKMLGKTPASIEAIRPLRNGVISDFYVAEKMISHYIKIIHAMPSSFPKVPRPKVVLGVPAGVTSVERRAVVDAAKSAGAREAYLLEEPMAAAIGAGLPITDPNGTMIVDLGGGTTEIAVISLGGLVVNKSLKVAGDSLDMEIVNHARSKYNILLGEKAAEEIKLTIGNVMEFERENELKGVIRGRDLKTGLPRAVEISAYEIREVLKQPIYYIIESIKDAVEETPAELVSDIIKSGITIAGGTSQLKGLAKLMSYELKVPVRIAEDPMTCVVRGCAKVLEDPVLFKKVCISF